MGWFANLSNHDVKVYSTWAICSAAAVLSILYCLILVRNCLGAKDFKFVMPLCVLFLISTISFGASVILFNNFQWRVTHYDFVGAKEWALYFNISTGLWISTLDVAHWMFFYRYFCCAITMPYSMSKKQVPRKLTVGLAIFDIIILAIQFGAPVMTMVYA